MFNAKKTELNNDIYIILFDILGQLRVDPLFTISNCFVLD